MRKENYSGKRTEEFCPDLPQWNDAKRQEFRDRGYYEVSLFGWSPTA